MRWETELPAAPKAGDKKVKTFFAFWPVTVGTETRWFETVTVEYEFAELFDGFNAFRFWSEQKFLEETK